MEVGPLKDMSRTCRKCGVKKPIWQFRPDIECFYMRSYTCKTCYNARVAARNWIRGVIPYTKLKSCSSYLGVHVSERLLEGVFKSVERMPLNNHGYDFVCGRGYKVDSKCSTMKISRNHSDRWQFDIDQNTTADYFACIAFDNRDDLTPMHLWIIPGKNVNNLQCLTISKSTIEKWSEYEKPIDRVVKCCDALKLRANG